MKAIHNSILDREGRHYTMFNTSKIQNESNSQPDPFGNGVERYYVQHIKDTK